MKKKDLRLGELICVALLFIFILAVSSQDKISNTSFEDVSKAVRNVCVLEGLESRDELYLKKKFGFDSKSFGGVTCYSSDSVMDVRELIIIAAGDASASVVDSLKKYVKDKENLFDGYAPRESELISSHVLLNKKGYILFYIGEEREKVVSAFSESL